MNGLDYAGESIAAFLHITTPKYSYEIEQFEIEKERIAREEAIEKENAWDVERSQSNSDPITQVPTMTVEKY